MRKIIFIVVLMTVQFLPLGHAATQKGNPDRYDTEDRGYGVGEEQDDGSVRAPDSNNDS